MRPLSGVKRAARSRTPVTSGVNEALELVETIEIADHPWFVGVQFHPEYKSKPLRPHPLFTRFVGAAVGHKAALK